MASFVHTFSGEPTEPPPELIAELSRQVAAGDPTSFIWLLGCLQALMLRERYGEAEAGLDEIVSAARERSTPSMLPLPLFTRAEIRRRTGRLGEAAADAAESLRLAEDTGQEANGGLARLTLALIDAVRGRPAECRAHAERMVAALAPSEAGNLLIYADQALGLLALGNGDLEEAAQRLGSAERRQEEMGVHPHPLLNLHRQDLVETLIRLGRVAEAEELLAACEAQAEGAGAVWPAAGAARCRGLLAPDGAFEEWFASALALHALTPTPFERARTELCLGERRRRARRGRDARAPLTSALTTFEALGAAPWAAWARRELRATGARPRRQRPSSIEAMTPQELQVALAVSRGATNKDAATALLISPKTVEYHLAKVYAKLGVRSRTELARRMASEGAPPLGTEAQD